mmetsp:Transcript_19930/g.41956  ORF Transcript_19930/g.41956 Transcript_19930/m.41956 type:complete len:93 (-) Transcript_19930:84-362(-)
MTVRLQSLCLPRKAWKGVSVGKNEVSGWRSRWLTKGVASASMAMAMTTLDMVILRFRVVVIYCYGRNVWCYSQNKKKQCHDQCVVEACCFLF